MFNLILGLGVLAFILFHQNKAYMVGVIIAAIISYVIYGSALFAIYHALFSWLFVLYQLYLIFGGYLL